MESEKTMNELSHIDQRGQAHMVDVSGKENTVRTAAALGRIRLNPAMYRAVTDNTGKKGDVLSVARIAGIQAAKRTWELIPLCHALQLTHVSVEFTLLPEEQSVECRCEVKCVGKTGVEMEALTGVNIALLTIYDMCKALGQDMVIGPIWLQEKAGGKTGAYRREELP